MVANPMTQMTTNMAMFSLHAKVITEGFVRSNEHAEFNNNKYEQDLERVDVE
jgi:hypothetical protein